MGRAIHPQSPEVPASPPPMNPEFSPEDLLEQTHASLEALDHDPADHGGMDRRQFVFFSLVSAAASTFAASAAVAQGAARPDAMLRASRDGILPQPPVQPPVQLAVPPLGNGEAPAEQFMPYPGGTGALLEKTYRERGPAAFTRATFTVEPWTGPVPTDPAEIAFLPAHRLAALLRARRITSARLTDIYLERMERLNPTLRFAVTIMADSARAEAKRADAEIAAGRYRGPLHGIPYGIKDLFSTKGAPTTWGSPDLKDQVIDEDAEVVVRLRNAGAVLLAKLSTGIFAQNDQWYGGRTNNPWNPVVGSSGSSAGPGSATAAGCVAFGIGTETQGSITSPSTRNGLSALRPTFGRVSRHGGMVLSWTQDRVGPMCRTIEDCALVFNAIHGVDEKDASTITMPFRFDRNIRMAGVRIGYDNTTGATPQQTAVAAKELVDGFRALGARMTEVPLRPRLQEYGMGGGGLNAEYAAAFDFFVQRKAKEIGLDLASLPAPAPRTPGGGGGHYGNMSAEDLASPMAPANWNPRFVGGRNIRAYEYINVQRRRLQYATAYQGAFKDVDLIISARGDVGENAQTGNPCAVVPYKFDVPTGFGGGAANAGEQSQLKPQPICGIVVGALYADDVLLSAVHQFQKSRPDLMRRHPEL